MPALKLFGRRWHTASDDVVIPASLGTTFHLCWVVITAVGLAKFEDTFGCHESRRYAAYFVALLGCRVLSVCAEGMMAVVGLRGTMLETYKRRAVAPLIYATLVAYALTLGVNVFGTITLYHTHKSGGPPCSRTGSGWSNRTLTLAMVWSNWVLLVFLAISLLLAFNLFPEYARTDAWDARCRCLNAIFCCWDAKRHKRDRERRCSAPRYIPLQRVSSLDRVSTGTGGSAAVYTIGRVEGPSPPADVETGTMEASATVELVPRVLDSDQDAATPLTRLAAICSLFFGTDDFTISDFTTALSLVGIAQRLERQRRRRDTEREERDQGGAQEPPAPGELPAPGPLQQQPAAPGGSYQGRGILGSAGAGAGIIGHAAGHRDDSDSGEDGGGRGDRHVARVGSAAKHAGQAVVGVARAVATLAAGAVAGGPLLAAHAATAGDAGASPPADGDPVSFSDASSDAASRSRSSFKGAGGLARGDDAACSLDPPQHLPNAADGAAGGSGAPGAAAAPAKCCAPAPRAGACASADPSGPLASSCDRQDGRGGREGTRGGGVRAGNSDDSGAAHDAAEVPVPLEVLEDASRYFRFALGSYGWPMYLWVNRGKGHKCCRLCMPLCFCCLPSRHLPHVRTTGVALGQRLSVAAIHDFTHLPEEDLLYVSHANVVAGVLPYFIAADSKRQELVISIRGSMSMEDCVTDLLCEPTLLPSYWLAGSPGLLWRQLDREQDKFELAKEGQLGSATSRHAPSQARRRSGAAAAAVSGTPPASGSPEGLVGTWHSGQLATDPRDPANAQITGRAPAEPVAAMANGGSGGRQHPLEHLAQPCSSGHEGRGARNERQSHSRKQTLGVDGHSWQGGAATDHGIAGAPHNEARDGSCGATEGTTSRQLPAAAGSACGQSKGDTIPGTLQGNVWGAASPVSSAGPGAAAPLAPPAQQQWHPHQGGLEAASSSGTSGAGGASDRSTAPGAAGDLYVHDGIFRCAEAILADLNSHGVLASVLSNSTSSRRHSRGPELRRDCRGWKLVVTGHSLGAGVAALLALHLRASVAAGRPTFTGTGPAAQAAATSVHCWSFAPPGGLVSRELSEALRPICTSLVTGRDMIPRLSVRNMHRLREQMIEAAGRVRVSKTAVWLRTGVLGKKWTERELFYDVDEVPDQVRRKMELYRSHILEAASSNLSTRLRPAEDFVVPGTLIYLEAVKAAQPTWSPSHPLAIKDRPAVTSYRARWLGVEELAASGLVVTRHMFSSHVPDFQKDVLDQVLKAARRGQRDAPAAGQDSL